VSGVYATNTVTELFFRQAVGRLVRWTGGPGRQAAYMLIPDDKRLRTFAAGIAEQRRHSLRKQTENDNFGITASAEADGRRAKADAALTEDRQCSLFAAISAVALDEQGRPVENPRVVEELDGTGDDEAIPDFVDMAQVKAPSVHALVFESIPLHPVPLPDPSPAQAPPPPARWPVGAVCAS
jgi:hypothetical protein